mmetsp:Transcript_34503/g.108336  ORF Transcript_34503/g.108336 Transcript_34503/m.108336 type:complete len:303 (-) Transcript_34503:235-1143(-)
MSDALGGDAWSSGSYLDCCGGLRVSFRDYRYLCLLSPPPPPLSPPPPPPRDGVRSFYIYRAQSDVDYPIGNHNLANLPGVLKYVHSEVVNAQSYDSGVCTRHYEISRILRYRLDFLNPPPFGAGFGPFVAFDRGRCTIYECATQADFWTSRGGFYVGCQEAQQLGYQGAAWYSLAGSCPGEAWERKGAACKRLQRGGECAHSRRPDGSPTCTWRLHPMGEVRLDELSRISDSGYRRYQDYCDAGHAEVGDLNNGQRRSQGGVCFWDKPGDPTANAERVATLEAEFRRRYPESPELPATYGCQ